MKKVLGLLVLSVFVASSAFAATSIVGSKHDLSKTGGGSQSQYSEICVFCHTPHNAVDPTGRYAPLWNRAITAVEVTKVYNSATFNATANTVAVGATDMTLCMTCHDGTALTASLQNPSNLAGAQPSFTNTTMSAGAQLDMDFSNDHPIGFIYDAALVAADGELQSAPSINGTAQIDKMVQCSTCHDVHDSTYKFIATTMSQSTMCLKCHIK